MSRLHRHIERVIHIILLLCAAIELVSGEWVMAIWILNTAYLMHQNASYRRQIDQMQHGIDASMQRLIRLRNYIENKIREKADEQI